MTNIFKKILSAMPLMTILGWLFPDLVAAYENWQSNKTPENMFTLGEATANTFAKEFDPALLPALEGYEHEAEPAVLSIISAAEEPSVHSIELALLEAAKTSVTILKNAGLITTDVTEESIQSALVPMYQLLADAGLK